MTGNKAAPSASAQAQFNDAQAALAAGDVVRAADGLRGVLNEAPAFTQARQQYATLLLHHLGNPADALAQIDELVRREPENIAYRTFRAATLGRLGDSDGALAAYRELAERKPTDAGAWLRYGHALKTAGRTDEAIESYRKSLALRPSGEGWWSLADLKTVQFTHADVAAMRRLAQHGSLPVAERASLHFALGKAFEDQGDFAGAFLQYDLGNTLKRSLNKYDPELMTGFVDRAIAMFTTEFFAARCGAGCDASDPIFIVGLPRSGSTLVEQILASHSRIEGTMELPDMIAIARETLKIAGNPIYPDALSQIARNDLQALGARYLARTKVYRRSGAPFFIDKLPDNFIHAGLIHLILPNAKIVDARRHPLACGMSAFKQNFAVGQVFSYGLGDIGRYYADYVRLMAHIDDVLPLRVHRVFYEALVADPEAEIRKLLNYIGVPFEDTCLRFHEKVRAVRTASSEQVRRPISRDALEGWKGFEPWLDPLKSALGRTLDAYPSPFREASGGGR